MDNKDIPTEDEIIFHSFEILFKVKAHIDMINREQKITLSIESVHPVGDENKRSFIEIATGGMTKNFSDWNYYLNRSNKNSDYAQFNAKSKKSAKWLRKNFSPKIQQSGVFIFQDRDIYFMSNFLMDPLSYKTSKKAKSEALMNCLENISQRFIMNTGFDKPRFKAWIERYAVLEEKEFLLKNLKNRAPSEERLEQSAVHKI